MIADVKTTDLLMSFNAGGGGALQDPLKMGAVAAFEEKKVSNILH